MKIDVSNSAPAIIDLKGEQISYVDGRPVKTHPKRDVVEELLNMIAKFEKDNQFPRKKSASSIVKRNQEYVKLHNAIPKSELRGLYNAANHIWNEIYG